MADKKPQKLKGLPKRVVRKSKEATRARSWANTQKKKATRRAAQDAAHKRNVESGVWPWNESRANRFIKRHP